MKTLMTLNALAAIATPTIAHEVRVNVADTSQTNPPYTQEVGYLQAINSNLLQLTSWEMKYHARYILKDVEIREAQYFDIHDGRGEIDQLSYFKTNKPFSLTLGDHTSTFGWDGHAKAYNNAKKYKFTFEDLKTKEEQSYYLYYNVGRGVPNPTDYAMVALMPGEKYVVKNYHVEKELLTSGTTSGISIHVPGAPIGQQTQHPYVQVPTIFGEQLDFYEMNSSNIFRPTLHGLGIANDYTMAGTMNTGTIYERSGDYLAKIKMPKNITDASHIGIQGNGLLKDFAWGVAFYAYSKLNVPSNLND